MPNIRDFKTMSQDLVTKATDAAGASIEKVVDFVPTPREVMDIVPTPREVVDQVTATANELLSLSQDVQNKVIAALKSNA